MSESNPKSRRLEQEERILARNDNDAESDYINANFVERTELGESASCDTTSTTTSNVETEVASNGREVDNGKEENEIKDSEDDSTAKKA